MTGLIKRLSLEDKLKITQDQFRDTYKAIQHLKQPLIQGLRFDPLGDGISALDLLDWMGDDSSFPTSARVSTGLDKREWNEAKDKNLIKYLLKHNHGTPMELCAVKFHIAMPIFVARQWIRHRIGWCLHGFNKVSNLNNQGSVKEDRKLSLYELSIMDKKDRDKLRIRGINEVSKEFVDAKIVDVITNPSVHFYTVKFSNGSELICSKDHKLFTNQGWQSLKDIVKLETVYWLNPDAEVSEREQERIISMKLDDDIYCYSEKRVAFNHHDRLDYIHECKKKKINIEDQASLIGVSINTIKEWSKKYNDVVKTNTIDFNEKNKKILAAIEHARIFKNKDKNLRIQHSFSLSEGQCYPVKIVDIEYFSKSTSYDLEVEMIGVSNKRYHNFFCNSILVHNSVNELSRRYSDDQREEINFYIPNKWRLQDTVNKQGSILTLSDEVNLESTESLRYLCEFSEQVYKEMVNNNIGKEMARMALPVNLYTRWYTVANFRSIAHWYNLRVDAHAQWEIQVYAQAMDRIMDMIFPTAWGVYKELRDQSKSVISRLKPEMKSIISAWFDTGKELNYKVMYLVASGNESMCPLFVRKSQLELPESKILEIYDLEGDKDKQINQALTLQLDAFEDKKASDNTGDPLIDLGLII